MKLLGIDTALNACSVAIVDGSHVLARVVSAGGKGNAERLLPLLELARREAGIELAALDGIAATVGPGSFTGIRTALATARALGLALKIPVWGITTTETLAAVAAQPGFATVAAIDAKRDELYVQCFAADSGLPLTEAQLLNIADAATILPAGPVLLVGSGSALLKQAAARDDLQLSAASPDPDPVLVAQLAASRPRPAASPSPLYIRPPDAKLPSAATASAAARLTLNIQSCGAEAAAVLAALHADAFAGQSGEIWSETSIRQLLAMPGAFALLAVQQDEQPAGFILLRQAADEAEVITLAVHPRLRRRGVARRLLSVGLDKIAGRGARRCFLEVAENNAAARGLYASAGFIDVGRRTAYYRDADGARRDAVLMRRE